MSFTVITPASSDNLTTLEALKAAMGLTTVDAARDAWLQTQIESASSLIRDELERPLTRCRVQERFDGVGRMTATLDVTPIAQVESLQNQWLGEIDITNTDLGIQPFRVDNAEAGIIWRQRSFPDDSPSQVWLTINTMAPQAGNKPWQATYLGGWLTRADDVSASGFSASGATISAPGDVDPLPLVAPGDQIALVGWPTNRGRVKVTERVDDFTITVDADLNIETAGIGAQLVVRNLPGGLERCCIDAVKFWYDSKSRESGVKSESIGDWSVTYGDPNSSDRDGGVLPGSVACALDRWRRLI
jgi:hypothetical protein